MTGISYKTTIDDSDMRAKLERLVERMERREGFFKNVGDHLLNSVGDNFDNEEGPDGEKWQILSAVTVARREAAGHGPTPILRVSGALRESINSLPSNDDVRIGSALVYAAIQHFGGESKGYIKGTIPARPYLGLRDGDEEAIIEIAEDWLTVE